MQLLLADETYRLPVVKGLVAAGYHLLAAAHASPRLADR